MRNKKGLATSVLSAFILSACGSSGSSTDNGSVDTAEPDNTAPTWTQGVFSSESNFKNRCESPRTGVDADGNAYADQAGSKLHEKHWLRSWSNNTYLWYDEIIDSDIAAIEEPIDYFESLKTNATTLSDQPKDKFHYSQSTADYQKLVSSGASVGYGARFTILKSSPPREGRVAYVEPNSPAAAAGLSRGDEIISIDGVDAINGADYITLNLGLSPKVDGEQHTFVIRDLGQTTTRTVVLEAQVVTSEPVKDTRVITTTSGKIGYLALNTFGTVNAEAALVDAFTELSAEDPDDLVVDLRYNGGGIIAIASQLGYMIAGSSLSDGKTFTRAVFNNKHPLVNPVTGSAITDTAFIDKTRGFSTTNNQPLPSLNLNRVYVLSSGNTCSASESLINGLRGIDVEVVLIGGTTCGKPYAFYPTDNCGTTYSTVQIRGENAKGFGDYSDGFSPNNATGDVGERIVGCQVTEDVLHPLGDEQEIMLKAALNYRNTSTCPAVPASRPVAYDAESDLKNDPAYKKRELLERIRLDHLQFLSQ